MPVDTKHAEGRRPLRFETLDEIWADVQKLAEAERTGTLKRMGNWSLGQTLGHLAKWVNGSFEGFPIRAPWFIRLLLRPRKKAFIYGKMPAGVHLPKVEGGTLWTDTISLDEGLSRYRSALDRLSREVPTQPSPAFGMLTQEEAIAANCRHAELHLSFMMPA